MLLPIDVPFPLFPSLDGTLLDEGKIYIGVAGDDPETNPVQLYWDAAGTIPAAQPLRTAAGLIENAGTPANVYGPNSYSIRVRTKQDVEVFYKASVDPRGASDISYTPDITGGVTRTATAKMGDILSVTDFGAVADCVVSFSGSDTTTGTDNTAFFQAAIDAASAQGIGSVFVPAGNYLVTGTIVMRPGVTLYGECGAFDYYPYAPSDVLSRGASLIKPNNGLGAAGPLIQMVSSSCVDGLQITNRKLSGALTGAVRFGSTATNEVVVYARLRNCAISAIKTGDLTGVTTARGIFFPAKANGFANYFHEVSNCYVTECDIGIGLQGNANANRFNGITTRECQVHYQLNGSLIDCIENTFTNLALFTIVPHGAVGFRLEEGCKNNVFLGFTTEMYGTLYDISTLASTRSNKFLGCSNETNPSYVPAGNLDLGEFDIGTVNAGLRQMTLPTRTTGDRNTFLSGSKAEFYKVITGAMPQMDNNAGTLTAGDPDSKVILRFGSAFYAKTINTTARFKLKVYADGNAGLGVNYTEVEFVYRCTNQSTGAGQLCVLSVVNKGNGVTGLHFLTGVASGLGFGVALTGGNGGAVAFDGIRVSLEVEAQSRSVLVSSAFTDVSFATADVTANDVTDAISLLTVADTTV